MESKAYFGGWGQGGPSPAASDDRTGGDDTFMGGAGTNRIIYAGPSAGYRFGLNTSGQLTVADGAILNGPSSARAA